MKPSRMPQARQDQYGRKNSVTIGVDMAGLDDILTELGDAVETATRPAAQAAAEVLYGEVQRNIASIGRQSGNLAAAIYQAYSLDNSSDARATYHVSWNAVKAPHGHLIEHGFIQRYATYLGKDGKWHTAIRPEMRGKPKPKRRASQAEKDAYYVPRQGGPVQVAARSFIRRASSAFPKALQAAEQELLKRIAKG